MIGGGRLDETRVGVEGARSLATGSSTHIQMKERERERREREKDGDRRTCHLSNGHNESSVLHPRNTGRQRVDRAGC
jgi:hypothetical protein